VPRVDAPSFAVQTQKVYFRTSYFRPLYQLARDSRPCGNVPHDSPVRAIRQPVGRQSSRFANPHGMPVLTIRQSARFASPYGMLVLTIRQSSRFASPYGMPVLTIRQSSRFASPHGMPVLTICQPARLASPHDSPARAIRQSAIRQSAIRQSARFAPRDIHTT
jgi:hypothetical protein